MIGVNEDRVPSMLEMRRWHTDRMVVCYLPPHGTFLRREDQPTMVCRRYADDVVVHVPDPPTRS